MYTRVLASLDNGGEEQAFKHKPSRPVRHQCDTVRSSYTLFQPRRSPVTQSTSTDSYCAMAGIYNGVGAILPLPSISIPWARPLHRPAGRNRKENPPSFPSHRQTVISTIHICLPAHPARLRMPRARCWWAVVISICCCTRTTVHT